MPKYTQIKTAVPYLILMPERTLRLWFPVHIGRNVPVI